MTGQNKNKIITSGRDMQKSLQNIAEELHLGESSADDMNRRRQLKFCVEWAIKNTFGMIPYYYAHEAMAFIMDIFPMGKQSTTVTIMSMIL